FSPRGAAFGFWFFAVPQGVLDTQIGLVFGCYAVSSAGIRALSPCFMRCPCAGRHSLSLPPQRK
ncbi:MAG TPA: hypothetical protein VN289_03005, partial [Paraburkholderia sp.]|nr:hypothetical protein [Paraburkholderia sp.]